MNSDRNWIVIARQNVKWMVSKNERENTRIGA